MPLDKVETNACANNIFHKKTNETILVDTGVNVFVYKFNQN